MVQEPLGGVDVLDDVDVPKLSPQESSARPRPRLLTQQSVVDEDAGEAVSDGALDEDRSDRGVDSAREAADGVSGETDLLSDARDGGFDEVSGGPVLGGAADVDDEITEELSTLAGVGDFGVELHGPHLLRLVGDGGYGVVGPGDYVEAGREGFCVVAMTHPDV